jgi:glutathione S-transferase
MRGLGALNAELVERRWLVSDGPTFGDVDLYGVVSFAPQAGIALEPYPHVADWMQRIEALPGFGKPDQILPRESRKA